MEEKGDGGREEEQSRANPGEIRDPVPWLSAQTGLSVIEKVLSSKTRPEEGRLFLSGCPPEGAEKYRLNPLMSTQGRAELRCG